MRKLVILAIVLALAYLAWPAWSAWQLRAAIKARDLAAIERKVDWPLLRSNLKRTLGTSLSNGSSPDAGRLLEALKRGLGGIVADTVVDVAVTPRTLPHLLAGRIVLREIARDLPGAEPDKQQADDSASDPLSLNRLRWAFFESPTRFRIEMADPDAPQRRVVSVLALEGLAWRLVDVSYTGTAAS
jgi:hypothetical protein